MANPLDNIIKNKYLNQYAGATSGLNQPVTMADSPIFQAGVQNWDPTSLATTGAEIMLPLTNIYSKLAGSDTVTYGLAGLGSGAAFKKLPKDATGIEQLKFADVFGHEMSHLGWDYKPKNKLINVPGVGKEGTKASAVKAGLGDPGDPNKYLGEEQWNYMHDLMYGPKGYSLDSYEKDLTNLKNQFSSGKINQDQYKAEGLALGEKLQDLSGHLTPGEGYLTSRGLINPGDLSYTPKAYNEIAWSGLTTPNKQAIGFGINPFEDTKAAGQWYAMQKYKNMSKAKKQAQFQEAKAKEEAAKAKAKADAAAAAKYTAPRHHQDVSRNRGDHTAPTFRDIKDEGPGVTASSGMHGGKHYANGGLINFYRYGGFV